MKAFSCFFVKSRDDDRRVISGIASTPNVDRQGDVVVPEGAVFKTPLPLLRHHDSRLSVGQVISAKVTKGGIEFIATLPRVDEPGPLRDRVEEAWQSVKYGLVGGLSIGFRALQDGVELLKSGGLKFNKWEWLELSLVEVPAQPDAVIHSFKSLDSSDARRLLGVTQDDDAERDALIQSLHSNSEAVISAVKSADLVTLSALGRKPDTGRGSLSPAVAGQTKAARRPIQLIPPRKLP